MEIIGFESGEVIVCIYAVVPFAVQAQNKDFNSYFPRAGKSSSVFFELCFSVY